MYYLTTIHLGSETATQTFFWASSNVKGCQVCLPFCIYSNRFSFPHRWECCWGSAGKNTLLWKDHCNSFWSWTVSQGLSARTFSHINLQQITSRCCHWHEADSKSCFCLLPGRTICWQTTGLSSALLHRSVLGVRLSLVCLSCAVCSAVEKQGRSTTEAGASERQVYECSNQRVLKSSWGVLASRNYRGVGRDVGHALHRCSEQRQIGLACGSKICQLQCCFALQSLVQAVSSRPDNTAGRSPPRNQCNTGRQTDWPLTFMRTCNIWAIHSFTADLNYAKNKS